MSYNPTRQSPNTIKHAKRQKAQQAGGTTHAKAVRSQGVGTFAPTTQERISTKHGLRATAMDCEHFNSYYECIYAGNNLGFGINGTGHRTVRVAKGSLFVMTAPATKTDTGWEIDNSGKKFEKLLEGSFVNFPAGTAYCLCAGGSLNVELLITESPKYQEGWVECEAGVIAPGELPYQKPPGFADNRSDRVNNPHEREVVASRSASRRQRQAQVQNEANRAPARFNANSSSVVGVNPMPMVITEE